MTASAEAARALRTILRTRIVPIIRTRSADWAMEIAETLAAAGLDVLEVTFTVPDAASVIARLRTRFPDVLTGAGTVTDAATAERAIAVGAQFLLSAAAQIGGVLEPVSAAPVIIEDDVLVGGNCGVYEGTIVQSRVVLGAGTILTRSTPIYDLVHEKIYRAGADKPLVVPENAVVVPGSRAIAGGEAAEWKLSLYTPVIVKYRDASTQSRVELEEWLR